MNCPRCSDPLTLNSYERISVYSCAKSCGAWLKSSDLINVIHTQEKQFAPALIEKTLRDAHKGLTRVEGAEKVGCPECATPMNSLNYDYSSGVIVNICPQGHGVWCDKDELDQVQIFMEHWNSEVRDHRQKWDALAQKSETEELARLDQIDAQVRKDMGPISRTVATVFNEFKKIGRTG